MRWTLPQIKVCLLPQSVCSTIDLLMQLTEDYKQVDNKNARESECIIQIHLPMWYLSKHLKLQHCLRQCRDPYQKIFKGSLIYLWLMKKEKRRLFLVTEPFCIIVGHAVLIESLLTQLLGAALFIT